ncbi:MAG: PAS/PAC sensor-containing diguanylate [Geobacteraceae bacterium]|nr:MAG: PAS/PAC sensor-containing diguanylate [Geobacteraceae bacterium]
MCTGAVKTAVVVNDDPLQLRCTAAVLEKDGFRVFPCQEAAEALAIMDELSPPDLIVTDLHMPGIDGWRFCWLLRSPDYPAFNKVPILVTSATFSGEDVRQITADLGANAFLPVPIKASVLRSHARSLIKGEIPQVSSQVLIIDDSRSLSGMLREVFTAHGYAVHVALTGEEGLALFRKHLPGLAILDYHLPDIGGDRLLHEIKLSSPSAAVIMITTDSTPELATRFMEMGADGYVHKPFDPDYLINLCKTVQRGRALLRIEDRLEERTQELQQSERRFRLLFDKMLNGCALHEIICDEDGRPCDYRFLEVNPAFEKLTGLSRDRLIGKRILEVLPETEPYWIDNFGEVALTGKPAHFENYSKALCKYLEVDAYSPNPGYFAVTYDDITERKQAEHDIQHLAYYDLLTSLPNRLLLRDRLEQVLAQADREGQMVGILSFDLDEFKVINDTLGHSIGDRLLKVVAARLGSRVRKGDTLARMGGDEFVVILTGVKLTEDVAHAAKDMLSALSSPYELDDREVFITTSIGIALYPFDGKDPDTLLKNADIAMYQAKEGGRNSYRFYTAAMNAKAEQRLTMETSLRHALERNEFLLHYQPCLDLKSGRITGMEALLRWQHPTLGLVPPDRFIPTAEETGLILPIGEWVLHTACACVKALQEAGFPHLRMAVNLSGRQLKRYDLVGAVASALEATGIDPTCLELELTESSIMENIKETTKILYAIREMGISLAIDDFGTGYSSLSYLKRFPIHKLKIDRSFVRDIPANPDDMAITRAIIAMAQSLKLKVTAEGVETEEQLMFMSEHDCDELQGYFISRPVPVRELVDFLQSGFVFAKGTGQGANSLPLATCPLPHGPFLS